jgi:pullulanase
MTVDLLVRARTAFVLWRPASGPVRLVIGTLGLGNPVSLVAPMRVDLVQNGADLDVWEVGAATLGLADGTYHYWFEVPGPSGGSQVRVTDPIARSVDWRLIDPDPTVFPPPSAQPAAVVNLRGGQLMWSDPAGEQIAWAEEGDITSLASNTSMVIYELPTRWVRRGADVDIGIGTFRDVRALVDETVGPADFLDEIHLSVDRSYLTELGINALELLPPADSVQDREWGYGTTNYFAPDYDLGFPSRNSSSSASQDLVDLVAACHRHGVRFMYDAVMGFSDAHPYLLANPDEFFAPAASRQIWGGDRWAYAPFSPDAYDPIDGQRRALAPAGALMLAHLNRWVEDLHIDGVRIDSVDTIDNWMFTAAVTTSAHAWFTARYQAIAAAGAAPPSGQFLVVGEELSEPPGLLEGGAVDALWHDKFRDRLRALLNGEDYPGDPDPGQTVILLVDPLLQPGYRVGSQAVNYIGTHDVQGMRRERICNYLQNIGVTTANDLQCRMILSFACLLTAIGIPLILAGDEFADVSDLATTDPDKEIDSINWSRMNDAWRQAVRAAVARLIHLRTTAPALAGDQLKTLNIDVTAGRRVVAYQRGSDTEPVITIVNFSDWGTDVSVPGAEYVIPGWPQTPAGRTWREATQDRPVPNVWAGREPIYPWEAKVYYTQ